MRPSEPQDTFGGWTEVPFTPTRRTIARKLRESAILQPRVTLFSTADATQLKQARDALAAVWDAASPSYTVLLCALLAGALLEFPSINGTVSEAGVRLSRDVNLAVAVDSEQGLVAPVIHRANVLSLTEVQGELRRLAEAGRRHRLSPQDLAGGTFTLTNLGAYGIQHFTPVMNPPQIGTLGVGALMPQPTWDASAMEFVRRIALPFSLSFDHAAIDGAEAARFLQHVVERVERASAQIFLDTGPSFT